MYVGYVLEDPFHYRAVKKAEDALAGFLPRMPLSLEKLDLISESI